MERVHTVSCCICVVACMFMVLGCVYITIQVKEMRDLHAQCKCAKDIAVGAVPVEEGSAWNGGHAVRNFEQALNYRLKRMVPNGIDEGRTRHKRKSDKTSKKKKPKKPKGKSKIRAGHYVTMVTDEYVKKQLVSYDDSKITSGPFSITEPCEYVPELRGILCRSKDFYVNNTEGTIHVFKPSNWTTKKLEPFSLKQNGEFQAKVKGIFFVYAQVLFNDKQNMQMVVINHKSKKTGRTEHVLSCTTVGGGSDQQASLNSCSMHGLISLGKNDILTVENVYTDVRLHFRKATTYFGAFVLK